MLITFSDFKSSKRIEHILKPKFKFFFLRRRKGNYRKAHCFHSCDLQWVLDIKEAFISVIWMLNLRNCCFLFEILKSFLNIAKIVPSTLEKFKIFFSERKEKKLQERSLKSLLSFMWFTMSFSYLKRNNFRYLNIES